ncbi:hypothetical protein J2X72_003431 [Phyllobacterium sp. 1468]|nr:hypothetical protein [Phyllobacterium sp. 1468]
MRWRTSYFRLQRLVHGAVGFTNCNMPEAKPSHDTSSFLQPDPGPTRGIDLA